MIESVSTYWDSSSFLFFLPSRAIDLGAVVVGERRGPLASWIPYISRRGIYWFNLKNSFPAPLILVGACLTTVSIPAILTINASLTHRHFLFSGVKFLAKFMAFSLRTFIFNDVFKKQL